MIKPWSTWYADMLPHLPECPYPLLDFEALRAAQTFFERTRAWQEFLPLIPVAAGQSSVTITPADATANLVRIEQAWYDSKPMGSVTSGELDSSYADDWTLHTGTPQEWYGLRFAVVGLYPLPMVAATIGLRCRVSLKPGDTATGLEESLNQHYRQALVDGAVGALMAYPNKPWSNNLAALRLAKFEQAIGDAQSDVTRSFGAARLPARVRWC